MYILNDGEPKERFKLITIWQLIYPILFWFVAQVIVTVIVEAVAIGKDSDLAKMALTDRSAFSEYFINHYGMTITLVSNIITIPALLFFMYLDRRRVYERGYKRELGPINYALFLLIPIFAFICLITGNTFVTIVLSYLPESFLESYKSAASSIYGVSPTVLFVSAVLFAPIMEELLFRGLIYKRVKRVSNVLIATIVAGLVFALAHGNWVQGIYVMFLNCALVFVYEKYKTILAPILVHMTANGISVAATVLTGNLKKASEGAEAVAVKSGDYMFFCVLIVILYGMIVLINNKVKRKEVFSKLPEANSINNRNSFEYDHNYYGDINESASINNNDEGYNG